MIASTGDPDRDGVMSMMWGGYGGWGWGHWLGMGIGMILFWGLIITGVVLLVRYLGSARDSRGPGGDGGSADPERILAERFARGDIDEEDYRQRREVLRGGR
ncbi:MAG TPA: SHOCT domain-containing protein [Pseudonocardia sp.]|jgi:putative membrane protein|nr:SHOCT domain-containing protein [Pseudonocardia sp.]